MPPVPDGSVVASAGAEPVGAGLAGGAAGGSGAAVAGGGAVGSAGASSPAGRALSGGSGASGSEGTTGGAAGEGAVSGSPGAGPRSGSCACRSESIAGCGRTLARCSAGGEAICCSTVPRSCAAPGAIGWGTSCSGAEEIAAVGNAAAVGEDETWMAGGRGGGTG